MESLAYEVLYADTEDELNRLLDAYYIRGWVRLDVTRDDYHLIDVLTGKHTAYVFKQESL